MVLVLGNYNNLVFFMLILDQTALSASFSLSRFMDHSIFLPEVTCCTVCLQSAVLQALSSESQINTEHANLSIEDLCHMNERSTSNSVTASVSLMDRH